MRAITWTCRSGRGPDTNGSVPGKSFGTPCARCRKSLMRFSSTRITWLHVLSKLAFAAMDSIVIPLSYNDMDFNRLFMDITENALFTDVLIKMDQIEQLQALVKKFMFTRVRK